MLVPDCPSTSIIFFLGKEIHVTSEKEQKYVSRELNVLIVLSPG